MNLVQVGLGAWGVRLRGALPPGARLSAVVTSRADARCWLDAETRVCTDLADALTLAPDGVLVTNPASAHVPTLKAIWAQSPGMPVWVEKPLGLVLAEARDLARLHADTGGGLLLVDHILLFNRNLLELVAGLSAPVTLVQGWDMNLGPFRTDCSALWDYGPHAVAVALWMAGAKLNAEQGANVRVTRAQRLGSEKGMLIELELDIDAQCRVVLVVGNGAVLKRREYQIVLESGEKRLFDGTQLADPMPLNAVLAAFCAAIEQGRAPEGDGRWGWALPLAVMTVLTEAERLLDSQSSVSNEWCRVSSTRNDR
ncbi:Gfo/Idh/MocA family protein [Candidatus Symbiobacter mobilis]|uniref:Dehydrogenase-like protein n=1 Tax=Candidatus Symbiobacter mobilis CR TaxID=946483 RepID=U5N9S4_9BURK|nr:dehydrogenase-like protein [Candidatus Symbiobacter mobilis]AGX88157.1 dehydrogenase-like protein [Candidatus Symbiobacter mobilis CR]